MKEKDRLKIIYGGLTYENLVEIISAGDKNAKIYYLGKCIPGVKRYMAMTDPELRDAVCSGDNIALMYMLINCAHIVGYHLRRYADNDGVSVEEAIHDFYLHLAEKNWARLRSFEGRDGASLNTYLSVVAASMFSAMQKKRNREKKMKENYHLHAEGVRPNGKERPEPGEESAAHEDAYLHAPSFDDDERPDDQPTRAEDMENPFEPTDDEEWEERVRELRMAMKRIPEGQILKVMLKYLEGKTPQQIADEMDITVANYYNLFSRGKKQLKEYFKKTVNFA
ncbi:MAG: sigma-70 family RNA polymerase sigma factor [Tannerella sp.]|nr:sigma-70 family RNA polymerase sigma factor [Tannerella sp.]